MLWVHHFARVGLVEHQKFSICRFAQHCSWFTSELASLRGTCIQQCWMASHRSGENEFGDIGPRGLLVPQLLANNLSHVPGHDPCERPRVEVQPLMVDSALRTKKKTTKKHNNRPAKKKTEPEADPLAMAKPQAWRGVEPQAIAPSKKNTTTFVF